MKVAILTQPLTNNYGGILQNFALQEVLRRKGHEVITLNIRRPIANLKIDLHWILSITKRCFQKYILKDAQILFVNAYKQTNWGNTPQLYQQRFIDEYIKVDHAGPDSLTEVNDKYDAYIVGSDQVWRPCFSSGLLTNYYLDFVENPKAKRLAYAASFGVDQWETDESTTKKIVQLAKKFDAISVREPSGIKLCKKNLGIDAVQVLDPTMLLNAEDYRTIYRKYSSKDIKVPYIATYVLDRDPRVQKVIQSVSQQMGLPVKPLGTSSTTSIDSIESWLEGLDKASYVITDSFHGCVFSIIFAKQFVVLGNKSRGITRFEGLFSQFNMNDRLVSTHEEAINSLIHKIDYEKIKKMIFEKQAFAHHFLDNTLVF